MKLAGSLLAFAIFVAVPALAAGDGMYLCRSPVIAGGFYSDLLNARQLGIRLDRSTADSIARKNECKFVKSRTLKPVDFVAGELAITDGTVRGWAEPHLYIDYINRD